MSSLLPASLIELPRVITPRIAAELGISRSRVRTEVRHGRWRILAAGAVLTRPDEPSRFDWAEAAIALGGRTAALSGPDAVWLHGAGREPRPSAGGLVLVRTGRSRWIGPVLIRRTDRPYSVTLTGPDGAVLPFTPLVGTARAIADTAVVDGDLDAVRAYVARAVQRRRCSPDELARELGHVPRNGSAHFRHALAEISAGARSVAEAKALVRLRHSRLPDFELNVPIADAAGRVVYEVDVLWRRLRAVLEIDSREFHFDRADWQATLRRHNSLSAARLSVVHFPPSEINRGAGTWLRDVEQWLRARAAELGVPYCPGSPGRLLAERPSVPLVVPGLGSSRTVS